MYLLQQTKQEKRMIDGRIYCNKPNKPNKKKRMIDVFIATNQTNQKKKKNRKRNKIRTNMFLIQLININ